jgi:hypothetical protein
MIEEHNLEKISLERTGCYGDCPIYKVTIYGNGTFLYYGKMFVRKAGYYTGRVDEWDLARITEYIDAINFWDLKDHYEAMVSCQPSIITTIVMDGKSKEVMDEGGESPAQLWALEELIDKFVSNARWRKITEDKAAAMEMDQEMPF